MSIVFIFYRDGANYKATEDFIVDDAQIEEAKAKYTTESWEDQEQANVDYRDLGITQDEFHAKIGWAYVDEYDHPYVIIEEIKPN